MNTATSSTAPAIKPTHHKSPEVRISSSIPTTKAVRAGSSQCSNVCSEGNNLEEGSASMEGWLRSSQSMPEAVRPAAMRVMAVLSVRG